MSTHQGYMFFFALSKQVTVEPSYNQGCQLSWIIWETTDFKPFLPVSRLESENSQIIAKVCHFL